MNLDHLGETPDLSEEEMKILEEKMNKYFFPKEEFDKLATLPDSSASLKTIFNEIINHYKQKMNQSGSVISSAYLIIRDYDSNTYDMGIFPLTADTREELMMHIHILKRVIIAIEDKPVKPNSRLVSVITVGNTVTSILKSDEVIDKLTGKFKKRVVPPSEDPNSKYALLFQLEEEFYKTIKSYEYITSDDGSTIVNNTPMMDHTQLYDEREAKNSSIGYLFTKPRVGLN